MPTTTSTMPVSGWVTIRRGQATLPRWPFFGPRAAEVRHRDYTTRWNWPLSDIAVLRALHIGLNKWLTAALFPVYRQTTIYMPSRRSKVALCCPPEPDRPEMTLESLEGAGADDELARLAKALGHPARVRIVRMLSRKRARVCSQIVDELPLAQSTVSEHLRILKEADLVRSSQDGTRVGYCVNFDGLRRLKALVAII